MSTCKHNPVYAGVVNIMQNRKAIGAVDVWRCRGCGALFCEEKRYGEAEVCKDIGFPEPKVASKWSIFVCRAAGEAEWSLMEVSIGDRISHTCKSSVQLVYGVAEGFSLESERHDDVHLLFLVEDYLNRTIYL